MRYLFDCPNWEELPSRKQVISCITKSIENFEITFINHDRKIIQQVLRNMEYSVVRLKPPVDNENVWVSSFTSVGYLKPEILLSLDIKKILTSIAGKFIIVIPNLHVDEMASLLEDVETIRSGYDREKTEIKFLLTSNLPLELTARKSEALMRLCDHSKEFNEVEEIPINQQDIKYMAQKKGHDVSDSELEILYSTWKWAPELIPDIICNNYNGLNREDVWRGEAFFKEVRQAIHFVYRRVIETYKLDLGGRFVWPLINAWPLLLEEKYDLIDEQDLEPLVIAGILKYFDGEYSPGFINLMRQEVRKKCQEISNIL